MPLEFKCLVTFDDTNVKVRFVGTCEGITDFTAQLFAVAGVTPTSYIPHVFDLRSEPGSRHFDHRRRILPAPFLLSFGAILQLRTVFPRQIS